MEEELEMFLYIIGGFIILLLLVFVFDFGISKYIFCPKFGNASGLEYKFDYFAGGCFVNYQGQWILKENLMAGKLD